MLNDILLSLDKKKAVFLVFWDLSAAFDMVDHKLVLNHLSKQLGIGGTVRDWIDSYLAERTQSVSVGDSKSSTQHLVRGVLQGLVLGPIFFTIYTQPLGDIIWKHKMDFHLYADDTQLYLTFDSSRPDETSSALSCMEHCISDIKEWVLQNKLKLNDSKTEFLQFQPCHHNSNG